MLLEGRRGECGNKTCLGDEVEEMYGHICLWRLRMVAMCFKGQG